MASSDRKVNIPEFFQNRSILVTGGISFLGKILVEKLLRSCPNLKTVYLLGRPRNNQRKERWLNSLTRSKLFSNLRRENAEVLNKIVLVTGDMSEEALGLSAEDKQLLVENVSIVFHAAAVYKFDTSLAELLNINVLGMLRMVEICNEMSNLKALVFVSTIFSQCNKSVVSETVEPAPIGLDDNNIKTLIDCCEKDLSVDFSKRVVGSWKAPFAFTAALAEGFLPGEINGVNCAIVRPSLVTACWKEPMPGCKPSKSERAEYHLLDLCVLSNVKTQQLGEALDVVPADLVANAIIAAAWYTATSQSNDIEVFNCSSEQQNPVRWRDVTSGSYIIWGFAKLKGFIECVMGTLPEWRGEAKSFFPSNLNISTSNMENLLHSLKPEDRTIFNIDIREVVWSECCLLPKLRNVIILQILSNTWSILNIGLQFISMRALFLYLWNRKPFTDAIMKSLSDALPKGKRRVHPEY